MFSRQEVETDAELVGKSWDIVMMAKLSDKDYFDKLPHFFKEVDRLKISWAGRLNDENI